MSTVDIEAPGSEQAALAGAIGIFSLVPTADGEDITAAAQAVLDRIEAAGGGVFYCGVPGTYILSDRLLVSSNTTVRLGNGVTFRKVNNAQNNVCMIRNKNMQSADRNITIEGGTWDGNWANNNVSLVASDKTGALTGVQGEVSLIGVANAVVQNVTIQNSNGFAVQWIGVGGRFENISWGTGTYRDGIHVNGPSSDFIIRNIRGYSRDDFVAINAWDWTISGPSVGDITDFLISDLKMTVPNDTAVTAGMVKLLPGTRASTQANVRRGVIQNVRGRCHNGVIKFNKDTNVTYGPSGVGQISDIDIRNLDRIRIINNAELLEFTQSAQNITVDGIKWDSASIARLCGLVAGETIDRLLVNNLVLTAADDNMFDIKGTITELVLSNCKHFGGAADASLVSLNNGGAITRLIINGLIQTDGGSVVFAQGNAANSETDVSISDAIITATKHPFFAVRPMRVRASNVRFINIPNNLARVDGVAFDGQFESCQASYNGGVPYTRVNSASIRHRGACVTVAAATVLTPSDGDVCAFDGTPSYAGVNVISGTGAGVYIYRGTGTVGWIKLN